MWTPGRIATHLWKLMGIQIKNKELITQTIYFFPFSVQNLFIYKQKTTIKDILMCLCGLLICLILLTFEVQRIDSHVNLEPIDYHPTLKHVIILSCWTSTFPSGSQMCNAENQHLVFIIVLHKRQYLALNSILLLKTKAAASKVIFTWQVSQCITHTVLCASTAKKHISNISIGSFYKSSSFSISSELWQQFISVLLWGKQKERQSCKLLITSF